MFRIYADANSAPADYSESNVPYKPQHYLPVSLAGTQAGDFTMVFGFPGSTDEYMPATELELMVGQWNPAKIELRTKAIELMVEAMKGDEQIKIQYASTQAGLSNSWKKWIGIGQRIEFTKAIEKKRVREEQFQKAVATNRRFDARYKTLLPNYDMLYGQWSPTVMARDYYFETCFRAMGSTYFIYRLRDLEEKLQAEGAEAEMSSALVEAAGHFKDYNDELERTLFVEMMQYYVDHVNSEMRAPELNGWNAEKALELFNDSYFTSEEQFNDL